MKDSCFVPPPRFKYYCRYGKELWGNIYVVEDTVEGNTFDVEGGKRLGNHYHYPEVIRANISDGHWTEVPASKILELGGVLYVGE